MITVKGLNKIWLFDDSDFHDPGEYPQLRQKRKPLTEPGARHLLYGAGSKNKEGSSQNRGPAIFDDRGMGDIGTDFRNFTACRGSHIHGWAIPSPRWVQILFFPLLLPVKNGMIVNIVAHGPFSRQALQAIPHSLFRDPEGLAEVFQGTGPPGEQR